jgi:hypothetical protein
LLKMKRKGFQFNILKDEMICSGTSGSILVVSSIFASLKTSFHDR